MKYPKINGKKIGPTAKERFDELYEDFKLEIKNNREGKRTDDVLAYNLTFLSFKDEDYII